MAFDVYQIVTDQIIGKLEQGTVPWRVPYRGGAAGAPKNLASGKAYRGVNVFLLAVEAWCRGYDSSYWVTYRQAQERGAHVKKGEKSTLVVFWKELEVADRETGEPTKVPVLRYYRVFNAAQCEGLRVPDAGAVEPLAFTPIEAAQRIVEAFAGGPSIEYGHTYPCYVPKADAVRMPDKERFTSSEEVYSTLFHELGHATGHSSRLDRGVDREQNAFGSERYSREELVAEMAAAFLCGEAGIEQVTLDNAAAYIAGWLKRLKDDKKLVVSAAGAAQKAADWVLGRYREVEVA